MTPERWQRINDLFHASLGRPPEERAAFLDQACTDDADARRAVERLLDAHARAGTFLETPAAPEPDVRPLLTGRRFAHYELGQRVGVGGMGEVYRAIDGMLGREVAIKVVAGGEPMAQARLRREAEHASGLNHPNICTIHQVGEAEGLAYIVMEYVEGRPLADVIPGGGLPTEIALRYAGQIAGALAHAHERGIAHRDLKSSNVMITADDRVKVLDFGLARRLGPGVLDSVETTSTAAGVIAGTLAYMAPEVLRGERGNARTDVWAFGVLLHEMLAGERPFEGQTSFELSSAILSQPPRRMPRNLSGALAAVVRRCLEKEPASRYASGREVEAALEDARFAARQIRLRSLLTRPRVLLPVVLLLLAAVGGAWLWTRSSRARWARNTALPEIAHLTEIGSYDDAVRLGRRAEEYIPGDPTLRRVMREITVPISVRTTPAGADVFVKSYLAADDTWESLGTSPISNKRVPFGLSRFRVTKEGLDTVEGAFAPSLTEVIEFTLDPQGSRPPGMVRVPGGTVGIAGAPAVELREFWLDKHEVANKDFKQFIEREGYQKREYWKHPFVTDGGELPWEQAMARFRDTTGRPGPSTWRLGTYADGQADFPVNGVSWYEAAAYAEFVGKSLPTIYHWYRAAGPLIFTEILSLSNFGGKGPAPVGTYQGIGPYGHYDMAGNVKEWCWNDTRSGRYTLGGAWGEPTYSFVAMDAQPPFDRAVTYGFRCAKYPASLAAALLDPIETLAHDFTKEKPVGDDVFRLYRSLYSYDRTDLKATVESVEETEHWRKEKITFNTAYGGERMAAYLFLPKNASPPYQTVIWFPGVDAQTYRSSEHLGTQFLFDFIPRTGRAVLYPIYKDTYERRIASGLGGPNMQRDLVFQRSKDLGRSIDYLETRADIDAERLAFYGFSWGVTEGAILTAVEGRFKASVLLAGGLDSTEVPPEVNPVNFASRAKMPVLMLNGRGDFLYPLERSALPLFRLLGAPEAHKRHVMFESGHVPPTVDVVKEILDWLDRYLGPVSAPRQRSRTG